MKALCIGKTEFNITLQLDKYPTEGFIQEIRKNIESGGGSVFSAASLLAKWHEDAYLCGVIGYDSYSEQLKKELTSLGVKIDFLETDYENKNSYNYIILNKENNSKTVLKNALDLSPIKKSDYSSITTDLIILDGYEYNTAIKTLKYMPNAISILDANRVNKEVIDLCGKVKFIVCSKEFAEEVSGIKIESDNTKTIVSLYESLKKKFYKQEIIVTLKEQGVLYSNENHIKILPALKVDVEDNTGAGDIFLGAFAYQLIKTNNIENSVKFANIAAGLSVKSLGVNNSYPELEEVNTYYEQI